MELRLGGWVALGLTNKSFHGDIFVSSTVKRSKVKKGKQFQIAPMELRLGGWVDLGLTNKSFHGDLFVRPTVKRS